MRKTVRWVMRIIALGSLLMMIIRPGSFVGRMGVMICLFYTIFSTFDYLKKF